MKFLNKSILITGGTGSFGNKFVEVLLSKYQPKKIIVFSRDEYKQNEMRKKFPYINYTLGNIKNKESLYKTFKKIDYIIHAAALKQIPILENNPIEAIKTNILGTNNIIEVAGELEIEKVVYISSDKGCAPQNVYGATKLLGEKIFLAANKNYNKTKFSIVRYGNVIGSRGSVIPLFKEQKNKGIITITDKSMTRFWMTLEQAVKLVMDALNRMDGGEIFIPKIPSMKIIDLAKAIAPNCKIKTIGIRAGEKIHETLISEHEKKFTTECTNYYLINYLMKGNVEDNFIYTSDKNKNWITKEEMLKLI